jgi:hypothetical protein
MKTHRFPAAFLRSAAVLLACLLIPAGRPAAAGQLTLRVGGMTLSYEPSSKKLAAAVAAKTQEVRVAFDQKRQELKTVPGAGGEPSYLVEEVSGLIARTNQDLDKALEEVGEPGLEGLSAWADEELGNLQERLAAVAPQAIARVASSGNLPLPAAAPQKATVSTSTADQLLDEARAVIERIFVLASNNDLEVELWVGSTPAEKTNFRFWPQGQIQGSAPTPAIIKTNGKRDHVLRGLYFYRASASLTGGSVTELIAYPHSAGASAAGLASERLDLVNGTSFFCCRFDEHYCQHVANKKECQP